MNGYHCALVTVSPEEGIERYDIYPHAVTGKLFGKHLENLREQNGERPLSILMD